MRKFILSLAYQYSLAYPLCVHTTPLGSTDRHNASRPQNSHLRLSSSWNVLLTSIRRGFCIITSLISLLHPTVGSTPSNVLPLSRNCARISFRYTRATWMLLVMICLGDSALACNLKLIVIAHHLLTCRSFSAVHIQSFFVQLGLGHRLMKSIITTSASSPIYNS